MTTVANDKLALAVQRLGRIGVWFGAMSTRSKTPAEARARREDEGAINTVLAEIRSMGAELAEWKENAMPFIAAWAASCARSGGRPDGELHPDHYDLLAQTGARMDGFTRGAP